jgi:hypothetical protein
MNTGSLRTGLTGSFSKNLFGQAFRRREPALAAHLASLDESKCFKIEQVGASRLVCDVVAGAMRLEGIDGIGSAHRMRQQRESAMVQGICLPQDIALLLHLARKLADRRSQESAEGFRQRAMPVVGVVSGPGGERLSDEPGWMVPLGAFALSSS